MAGSLLKVDCIMNTYGRHPRLLEECVESFLRQDYEGDKRLIIFNDCKLQRYEFNHPDVEIVNLGDRIGSIGEKFNLAVKYGDGDILMMWDDDDVSLPWRISTTVRHMDKTIHYFRPSQIFTMVQGSMNIEHGRWLNASAFSRKAFEAVGGAPDRVVAEFGLADRLDKISHIRTTVIPYKDTFYIYNKTSPASQPGYYHISHEVQFGGEREAYRLMEEKTINAIKEGSIPSGLIKLKPRWTEDYIEMSKLIIARRRYA